MSCALIIAGDSATAQTRPAEPVALIQKLCLETGAVWDKALAVLQTQADAGRPIREEKLGKATLYHLDLAEGVRIEMTVSDDNNAVMSCTLHAGVADLKATFAAMQKSYRMKGALSDYLLGQPTRNVPFVAQAGGKPGRKMLGLFEFQPSEGQAGGSVQAIILRDEAAAGPAPIKTTPIKTGSIAPARK